MVSPSAPQRMSPPAAPVCGRTVASAGGGEPHAAASRSCPTRPCRPRLSGRRPTRPNRVLAPRVGARLVGVGLLLAVFDSVSRGGVPVADHRDLVVAGVDRSLETGCGLVARAGAAGPIGGGATGAVGPCLVVGRLRAVLVADDGHLVLAGVHRCGDGGLGLVARAVTVLAVGAVAVGGTGGVALGGGVVGVLPSPITVTWFSPASTGALAAGSVWLPDPLPSSPLVVLPSVAPVDSPSVGVSAVLPSPITVTWLPVASTGAAAPASVWLPDPLPSVPDVSLPAPPCPLVSGGGLTTVGVAVTDDGHLVTRRVDRSRGGGIGLVARERAVVTVCRVSARAAGGAAVGRRCSRGVAVTDDGDLVAGRVDGCGGVGVGLVARAVPSVPDVVSPATRADPRRCCRIPRRCWCCRHR